LEALLEIGLSPREIECIRLRTEDLSYEEIAGVLGLRPGTVGALLARAHGKIRKAVGHGTHKGRGSARAATREKSYAS
jgi:DNA-directed RNA polymerase specialized sigma24 family protein